MRKIFIALVFSVLTANANAGIIYFGEDLNWFNSDVSTNADSAHNDFTNALTDIWTEDFENYNVGSSAPLAVDFGALGVATMSGSGDLSNNNVGGGPSRRAHSGSNYWETSSSSFTINFTEAVAAFGFYGIDMGDFTGQISLTLSGGIVQEFDVAHSKGRATNGALLYWGIIDTANTFTSITFANTGNGSDFFGFDDFTVGTVSEVPEPSSVMMMLIAMFALAKTRKRNVNR